MMSQPCSPGVHTGTPGASGTAGHHHSRIIPPPSRHRASTVIISLEHDGSGQEADPYGDRIRCRSRRRTRPRCSIDAIDQCLVQVLVRTGNRQRTGGRLPVRIRCDRRTDRPIPAHLADGPFGWWCQHHELWPQSDDRSRENDVFSVTTRPREPVKVRRVAGSRRRSTYQLLLPTGCGL